MKRSSSVLLSFIFLLLIASSGTVEAKDKWTKVQSKNFLLVGNGGEKDIRQVATKLEQFRQVFTKVFPSIKFVTPVPTTVIVFKDFKSYAPFRPRNAVGYFQPGEDINYITLTTETHGEQTPYSVIFHEYVHLLVNNSIGDDVPTWFNEGLAEYYSAFTMSEDRKAVLGGLLNSHLYSLRQQKLLPLRTLFTVDHKSAYYNEKDKQNIFYAQSWLLMHYFIQNEDGKRLPQFNKFFSLLQKGIELEKAFDQAFQIKIEDMEKELQQYLKKSSFRATAVTFEKKLEFDSEITSTPITEAESQAYMGDLLLHLNGSECEKYLQEAIALDPNLAMAHASLGVLRTREGRFAEAKKSLQKALNASSQNYLVHYYYAEAISRERMAQGSITTHFSPEELQTMRASLKKAIELMPSYPDSYRLLAFINLVAREQIDESIALLKRALTYSPGKQELMFMLAQCYLGKDDFSTAKKWLEPIANTSPREELKNRAKQLLNHIKTFEDSVAQREAFIKEIEEKRKNNRSQSEEITDGDSVLKNSQVESSDVSKNKNQNLKRKGEYEETQERQLGDYRIGMYQAKEGETQMRGQIVRIDCVGGKSVVLVIKVGEKLIRLYKADLANVEFVSFTTDVPLGGQIGCGPVKKPAEVIATFGPNKQKNSKYDGEIVVIEFVSKDFK